MPFAEETKAWPFRAPLAARDVARHIAFPAFQAARPLGLVRNGVSRKAALKTVGYGVG